MDTVVLYININIRYKVYKKYAISNETYACRSKYVYIYIYIYVYVYVTILIAMHGWVVRVVHSAPG